MVDRLHKRDYPYWKDKMEMYIKNKYNKICRLRKTREIWDSLSINYEGINDVQLTKVVTLTRHYESFTMKDETSVDEMFGRLQVLLNGLQVLLNGLQALRHTFTKALINLKILDNFSEARNLKTLACDEFLGILKVHEVHLPNTDHLPKKDFVALKSRETNSKREEKKSTLEAFKVHMVESDRSDNILKIPLMMK
ncbi:hypothetical protein JHK87_015871 [Glycine soja]|nr:hypothetical protein JHK87_015871 [Glycine soja]